MSETLRPSVDAEGELRPPARREDTPEELPFRPEMPLRRKRKPVSLRNALITALGVAVTCIVGVLAAHWWLAHRYIQSTDNAYLQADFVTVSPRIEGFVRELRVEENVVVEKGDVLLMVDDRNYRARYDQAAAVVAARRAQIAGDEATIASLDAQLTRQQSVIAQMKANLAVTNAELERSTLEFNRYEQLVASNVASKQRFETVRSDYKKALAEQAGVQANMEAEQRRVPVIETTRRQAKAKLKQSEADLAEAEAALELAHIQLQDTVIRAPTAGVVANRSARVGQYVRPGSALLAVVPRVPHITANFKETQLSAMRPGQKVAIAIDAYPDLRLEGRVESLSPATGAQFSILPPENASGNFTKIVQRVPVRIRFVGSKATLAQLSAGLSAVVSVDTHPSQDAATSVPDARE